MQKYSEIFIEKHLYWLQVTVSCLMSCNLLSCHVGSEYQITLMIITHTHTHPAKYTNQNTISRQISFGLRDILWGAFKVAEVVIFPYRNNIKGVEQYCERESFTV